MVCTRFLHACIISWTGPRPSIDLGSNRISLSLCCARQGLFPRRTSSCQWWNSSVEPRNVSRHPNILLTLSFVPLLPSLHSAARVLYYTPKAGLCTLTYFKTHQIASLLRFGMQRCDISSTASIVNVTCGRYGRVLCAGGFWWQVTRFR